MVPTYIIIIIFFSGTKNILIAKKI